MPIQINQSGSVVIPEKEFNSVWIESITISAPSPLRPITSTMQVCPFNTSNGEVDYANKKVIFIRDVDKTAQSSSYVAMAMGGIFGYVQQEIISKSLF